MPCHLRALTALACLLSLAGVLAPAAYAERERYSLDPEHTTVAFLVQHLGYADTLGQFLDARGSFYYDDVAGELDTLEVVVDTASLTTQHKRRDRHVRSKDFLHVDRHPQMRFVVDAARIEEPQGSIEGTLTLRGISRPLRLEVTLHQIAKYPFGHKRKTIGVSARGELDRSDYGMAYGVANGFVGDRVSLIIEIEANRD